jgi:hypothetical protein
LTRSGSALLADGVPVMSLRAPQVYDAANPLDVRPIAHAFAQVSGQWYVVLTLPSLAGMAAPVIDPTLTLQPDAAAGQDVHINEYDGGSNYGVDVNLGIRGPGNTTRTLIKFDLSSISPAATITAATLTLTLKWGSIAAETITFHRILAANSAWTETGANWLHAESVGNTHWAGSAGCSTSGTDYAATAMYTGDPGIGDDLDNDNEVAALALDTAEMALLVAANNGIVGRTATASSSWRKYYSSDSTTAGYRPKLVVDYTLPSAGAFTRAPMPGRW